MLSVKQERCDRSSCLSRTFYGFDIISLVFNGSHVDCVEDHVAKLEICGNDVELIAWMLSAYEASNHM